MRADEILFVPMGPNDAGAETIGDYLAKLLSFVWQYDSEFDGKRPFGNSGWKYEVYAALITAGLVEGKLDKDGYVESVNYYDADTLIYEAIFERMLG